MLKIKRSEYRWTMYDDAGNIIASADSPGALIPLAVDLYSDVLIEVNSSQTRAGI